MGKTFSDIVELSKYLRGEDGCPWDREQSLSSLKSFILEEAYEVAQAIEGEDRDELIEELGDYLFQVVFASQIASEEGLFGIDNVIEELHNKLIRRHPHIFGDEKAKSAEEAVKRWNSQKLKEKNGNKELLQLPKGMPSLLKAQRVGAKAAQVGFDWDSPSGVVAKIKEELGELETAINKGDSEDIEREFGDLIFSVVNLSRHLNVDAELACHYATEKFVKRFKKMESKAAQSGKGLTDMDIEEMEQLWRAVKEEE